jgi:hypothetical protein
MTTRLSDTPGFQRKRVSKVDLLPSDIRDQLVAARNNRTHSVAEMVTWLHDAFGDQYRHISKPMLDNWFQRWGYRADAQ